MRPHLQSIPFAVAICSCVGFSQAGSVSYLQSPLPGSVGFFSRPSDDQRADNFSFSQKTKVTHVRWWGTYLNNPPSGSDSFRVRFFAPDPLAGNVPQQSPSNQFTSLSVTRTDSGLDDFYGDSIYQYEAQLTTPVIFTAGATSYFSVLNGTSNAWFWQRNTNAGTNWFRLDEQPDSIWFAASGDENVGNLAFQLIGFTPPPGDYNSDFTVNETDYNLWRTNFSATSAPLAADGNSNGMVDAADYVYWRKNLGTAVGSGGSVSPAVPEPSVHMLAFTAMLVVGVIRARA